MNFNPFPKITTERLILRAINLSDDNELYILRSDPEILKYIANPPIENIEAARTWISNSIKSIQENKFINWGLTTKQSDILMGNICIWNIDLKNLRGEVGYTLHPAYQGNGYMNEAMTALINYGFKEIKLHSLEAHVNPNNTGSVRVLERNGFVKEAHLKENQCLDGQYYDTAIYSLLNSDD